MIDLLPVSAAADRLSLHPSRVRALIASGGLAAEKIGGVWLVDRASIAGRNRQPISAGAAPSQRLGVVARGVRGEAPSELEPSARWRVRRALEVDGLGALRSRLVRRAEPYSYWALPGELRALRDHADLVLSGPSAAAAYDLGLVGSHAIDAYVPASRIASLQREHALERMSGR